jgi:hypothetical protein
MINMMTMRIFNSFWSFSFWLSLVLCPFASLSFLPSPYAFSMPLSTLRTFAVLLFSVHLPSPLPSFHLQPVFLSLQSLTMKNFPKTCCRHRHLLTWLPLLCLTEQFQDLHWNCRFCNLFRHLWQPAWISTRYEAFRRFIFKLYPTTNCQAIWESKFA